MGFLFSVIFFCLSLVFLAAFFFFISHSPDCVPEKLLRSLRSSNDVRRDVKSQYETISDDDIVTTTDARIAARRYTPESIILSVMMTK